MLPRSGSLHFRAHGECYCSSRLALQWDETSAMSSAYAGHGSFPIVIPPLTTSSPTMAAADFCLITQHVTTQGAVERPLARQISPDKNVNFRYATAPFTLSPEPGALLCCANLPGDWALYDVSVRRLTALHSGLDARQARSRLRRAFRFAPPSDEPSRDRPCLRLVFMSHDINH